MEGFSSKVFFLIKIKIWLVDLDGRTGMHCITSMFFQVPGNHLIVFPGTSEHHRSRGRSYCGGNHCNLDLQEVSIDCW